MSGKNNSFLTFLQDQLNEHQDIVDQVVIYLQSKFGFVDIAVFRHHYAPDCYEAMGSYSRESEYRKGLIEAYKNGINTQTTPIEIYDWFVFPLSDHKDKVRYILIVVADEKQIREIPFQCWVEIKTIYRLAMANKENIKEQVLDKTINIVSRMAHDLNSLAALIPTAENGDQILSEQVRNSQKLSEDIMIYLREFPLRSSRFSARELFKCIIEEIDRPPGINYRINIANELYYVNVDIELIERTLVAVLENAAFACQIEGGEIKFSVTRVENNSIFINHDWLSVSVKDDGPGIPFEYSTEVTKPFFTTWKDQGHVGLGLSIADKIIRAHGGALSIKSDPGNGTITTFFLPLNDAKK